MLTALIVVLWILAALFTLSAFGTVLSIGKPRTPVTAALAVRVLVLSVVLVAALVSAALLLA